MSQFKKMTTIPVDEVDQQMEKNPDIVVEVDSKKQNSIRKYALDRQRKLINVILKLAQHGSYDKEGYLLRHDGSRLEESDFISLLLFAMSPGRSIRGLQDFIHILASAGITPNEVINIQVKELLSKLADHSPVLSRKMGISQDHSYEKRQRPSDSPYTARTPPQEDHPQGYIHHLPASGRPHPRLHTPRRLRKDPSNHRDGTMNFEEATAKRKRTEDAPGIDLVDLPTEEEEQRIKSLRIEHGPWEADDPDL